jgi:hypothetical protein
MEISIGDFGRMIFESSCADKHNIPAHWADVYDEAKPLVEKLLALNEKIGYAIIGLKNKKTGKKQLSKHDRIEQAQQKLWGRTGKDLKEGDYFWTNDGALDYEMYIGQNDPVKVDEVTKKGIYFEQSHCGGHHTERIGPETEILKAPEEYQKAMAAAEEICYKLHRGEGGIDEYNKLRHLVEDIEKEITSDEYWLKKADELGIGEDNDH